MAKVLIIDDDAIMAEMLAKMIQKIDHEAEHEATLAAGMQRALNDTFDVVFLDVYMPDGNGLEALKRLRAMADPPEVIIITGMGHPDSAELAIKNGAWDYIQKPLSPKKVLLPVKRVLQYRDNLKNIKRTPMVLEREGIVGNGARIQSCLEQLAQAAASEAGVLLTGETGTGKELFARTLHDNSSRRNHRMVVVDCSALPETLVESALFGHVKGAFTGADRSQEGLIRIAHGGTLFLDEVCEMSLPLQKTFLRVLQEKRFRPVGSQTEVDSDFRLIAATNRNPDEMVREGLFRKDLLYRLRAISIHLPPLRERKEDISRLVMYYTEQITGRYSLPPKGFSPEFIDALCRHDWPGNVRELMNVLESAVNTAAGEPILFPMHLPESIRIRLARDAVVSPESSVCAPPPTAAAVSALTPTFSDVPPDTPYREFRDKILSDAEKAYFAQLLNRTGGDIQKACRISGLGRTRLYALLKKHGISRHS